MRQLSIRFIISLFTILLVAGCKQEVVRTEVIVDKVSTNHPPYVEAIEDAHKKSDFYKQETVCFNLDLTFGKNNRKLKIFSTPSSSAIKVEKPDGVTTVMKDGKIYTNADSSKWNGEKFGVYTYQYFFMAPYKLSDEGTKWEKMPAMDIRDETTNSAMLTFQDGTGDAPNDWYILHTDPETDLLKYMGYIVTGGGTSVEEAEKNAHAIGYEEYKKIDGIPMSHKWSFYDYSKSEGLGDKIGEATLVNVLFMDDIDDAYDASGLTLIN